MAFPERTRASACLSEFSNSARSRSDSTGISSMVVTGTMVMRRRFGLGAGLFAENIASNREIYRQGGRAGRLSGVLHPPSAEMLRQLQALGLVVRADALAVELARTRQHLFIDQ